MNQTDIFELENYGKASTFASFLPGISGVKGIPIWCYYVNRGQCVVSFGVDNKDHSIMEFYSAHAAYQTVKRTGFRTFIRKNGKYTESFSDEAVSSKMSVAMNNLMLEENNTAEGIKTTVDYFTLPGEKLGALVRKVSITNTGAEAAEFEVLDGMPAIVPYGVPLDNLKSIPTTTKAWMQVEDVETKRPYYRVSVSMNDSADVSKVEGGNFAIAYTADGEKLSPIVDPEVVFSYDTALNQAVVMKEEGLDAVYAQKQNTSNAFPTALFGTKRKLNAGETLTIYELIGQVENKSILDKFCAVDKDETYFTAKKQEALALVDDLCKVIDTKTGSKEFDAYTKYTYMDNVLRGGFPIKLGNNKIFYVYSRKHGDLERDYNFFSMLPEFYSQGNGNFRDVNQNRRCDTFFAPYVGRKNIKEFYSFIQLDGYNPLGVEKLTYQMDEDKAKTVFADVAEDAAKELVAFVTKAFTPGALCAKLDAVLGDDWNENLFTQAIDFAEGLANGNFGEGYWSDHWTYNLDLIEDYLEVNPEKEQEMLYEEDYTYFLEQVKINPRYKRYAETPNGLRQYYALDKSTERNTPEKLVRTDFGKGEVLKSTLLEKLLLMCTVKFAALDAYGMGIEMEGGKPGWYDALNGMPGMFGSSMNEAYEVCRMMEYTIEAMKKFPGEVHLLEEHAQLLDELNLINIEEKSNIETSKGSVMSFWNRINDAKEAYWEKAYNGVSGKKVARQTEDLLPVLEGFHATVAHGIEKAYILGDGIAPAYFTFEVPSYQVTEEGIIPDDFKVVPVPYFLEGPVRYLKLDQPLDKKRELYNNVKNSDVYDEKLSMYKVNASLKDASYELGRCRAFTPGWLENESIWLHMEYKYLLELIRCGLYEEFFEDFHKAAIPFLDPKVYGRSTLENSSFIVSSKNPNEKIHGKGFVARLSGSTIEFVSMWKLIMFGRKMFTEKDGELVFSPQPAIPEYLVPEDKNIKATLLGEIEVIYKLQDKKNYIPGQYEITDMQFEYKNGSKAEVSASSVTGQIAKDIREANVSRIEITLK